MSIKKSTETDLVRVVLDWLHLTGFRCTWRAHAGVGLRKGRPLRGNVEGTPDIIGILPPIASWCFRPEQTPCPHSPKCHAPISGGRFLGIELKARRGRLRDSQLAWQQSAREAGALVITARSLADVEQALRQEGYLR